MSVQELYNILIQSGLGVYYDHYVGTVEQPNIEPPFILYRNNQTDTFKADNLVWDKDLRFIVDLVVETKDIEKENLIETLFENNKIIYEKEETYIPSERIYQVSYFI